MTLAIPETVAEEGFARAGVAATMSDSATLPQRATRDVTGCLVIATSVQYAPRLTGRLHATSVLNIGVPRCRVRF